MSGQTMKLRPGDKVDIKFDRLVWRDGQDMKGRPETQTFEVFKAEIIGDENYVELRRDHKRKKQILNIKLNLNKGELKTNGKVGEKISFESRLGKEKIGLHSSTNIGLINMTNLYFSGEDLEETHEELKEGIIEPPTQLTIVNQGSNTMHAINEGRLDEGRLGVVVRHTSGIAGAEGGGWKKKSKKKKKKSKKKKKKSKKKKIKKTKNK